jgi:hypothetical protein
MNYLRCVEIRLSFYIIIMHLPFSICGGKVSLMSRLQAGGIDSWYKQEIFYSPRCLDWFCALSTYLPLHWVLAGFLCWLKWPGCEADYSAQCSIEVSVGSSTSMPPYLLVTCTGTSVWRAHRMRYGKWGCHMLCCNGLVFVIKVSLLIVCCHMPESYLELDLYKYFHGLFQFIEHLWLVDDLSQQ